MSAEKTTPSPLPWTANVSNGFIDDAKGERVCQFWDKFEEDFANKAENMALIVQRVNAHDDLLSMLARVADAEFGFGGWPTEAEISAVLANARGAQPAEPRYYLQDTRTYVGNCPLWWAHGGKGYTTDVRQAHRYTLAEAMQQHEIRDTDRPWPCADIDKLIRHTVDMQDMRRIKVHPMDACRHGNRKSDCDHCKETL